MLNVSFDLFLKVILFFISFYALFVILLNVRIWPIIIKALFCLFVRDYCGVRMNIARSIVSTEQFIIGKTEDNEIRSDIINKTKQHLEKIKISHFKTLGGDNYDNWLPHSSLTDALYSLWIGIIFHIYPSVLWDEIMKGLLFLGK